MLGLRTISRAALSIAAAASLASISPAAPLLPDLIPWASDPNNYIYDGTVVANSVPGKTVYRFDLPIANIGDGPLELRLQTVTATATQDIYQRIFDSGGGLNSEHHVGTFDDVYPPYGQMFLEGIAHYRIRAAVPGDTVGDQGAVLTTHEKISYNLLDGPSYNLSLPGAPATRQYSGSASPGISVGWADIYRDTLPQQWADLTDLANGDYWLEVEIDPFNRIVEKDETNNVTRVLIENLVIPEPTILAGDYNLDGTVDAADYTVWRNTFGQDVSTQGTGADGDGSRRIGPPDYDIWRANYGRTDPSLGAGGVSVPEPSISAILLTLAACGLAASRTVAAPRT